MMRLGESLVRGLLVAQPPLGAEVVLGRFVNSRRRGVRRFGRIDVGRQFLVIDLDQLDRVLRLIEVVRNHHGDQVADETRFALHQRRARRGVLWRLGAGRRETTGYAAEPVRGDVVAGQNGDHARRVLGRCRVDSVDLGVGVR